jgi:hypothetical protein
VAEGAAVAAPIFLLEAALLGQRTQTCFSNPFIAASTSALPAPTSLANLKVSVLPGSRHSMSVAGELTPRR